MEVGDAVTDVTFRDGRGEHDLCLGELVQSDYTPMHTPMHTPIPPLKKPVKPLL